MGGTVIDWHVSILERERDILGFINFQEDFLKTFKDSGRLTWSLWEGDVELNNFFAITGSIIFHGKSDMFWIRSINFSVIKGRVAETMTKGESWSHLMSMIPPVANFQALGM